MPVGSSASRISGLLDEGAGDRGALLLAARQDRRQHVHALAEADPFQQLDHVGAIARLLAAAHTQRQRDVLVGRQVVEQAEILEDDADAPAQQRQLLARDARRSLPKMVISPRVGFSDRKSSLSSVVLPAPDGPLRNWNERSGMWKEMSRRISGPIPYRRPTFSKRITCATFLVTFFDAKRRPSRSPDHRTGMVNDGLNLAFGTGGGRSRGYRFT